ncbi:protein prenyltransferase alpha subunit repeat-containing protein 1 [Cimex lectularius]|uniref:Uncharacterized protein n=1 Tax=Cimex lectularius TaxID=79782 RepID=A0A8I6REY1_CIMLE|nr:protein prenyltransferase alpha subunit repeat-containing protein 1 [Cimex lectularius]
MNVNEDFYAAAEKILSDIEQIFRKDPKLHSFEIIPVVTNENKSPVYHVEHCLGLESWCIPHIFCHAYQNVISMRQNKGCRDLKRLNTLLMGALMINPEITTFWNMRKELINSGKLDAHFELHFTAVILTRKPKSADVFLHRKWILKKLLLGVPEDFGLILNEMNICEVAADRYSNNYHAWTHRAWCLMQGEPLQGSLAQFYQQELNRSEMWISKHVSDYSGLQFRQQLLKKIFQFLDTPNSESVVNYLQNVDESIEEFFFTIGLKNMNIHSLNLTIKMQICIYELILNTGFIKDFIGHEALWYHRRFVFNFIKESLIPKDAFDSNKCWGFKDISHLNCDAIPVQKQNLDPCYLNEKFILLLSIFEDNFLKKYTSNNVDSREKLYAERHAHWLERYLKFKLPYNLDLLKGTLI